MPEDHPHARIAKELWTSIAAGDIDALLRVMDPNIVWHSMGNNRVSGEYHGPAEVMGYLATVGDLTTDLVSTLDEIYVGAEGSVVIHHVTARRGTKKLDMDYMIRLAIRNELIVSALAVPVDQRSNDAFWA